MYILIHSFLTFLQTAFYEFQLTVHAHTISFFNPIRTNTASATSLILFGHDYIHQIKNAFEGNDTYFNTSSAYYGGVCQSANRAIYMSPLQEFDFKNAYINRIKERIPENSALNVALPCPIPPSLSARIISRCINLDIALFCYLRLIVPINTTTPTIPSKYLHYGVYKTVFPVGQ